MLGRRAKHPERRGTPADLLVVGLGNPGARYEGTRHNLGVEVLGILAERHGGRLKAGREQALVGEVRLADKRIVLAFPQTFMNESGRSVVALTRRHGIEDPERLVVIHDELDLAPGVMKVKRGGGLAGNNGLRSIHAHLHTDAFLRIRVGIGKPPSADRGADFVLKPPGKAERVAIEVALAEAADAVELIAAEGADSAMQRYNAAR